MEHSLDFVGHIEIAPPLNGHEMAMLSPPGVPPLDGNLQDRPGRGGESELGCAWHICQAGCCLVLECAEDSSAVVRWLRLLISRFLKAGATARGRLGFDHFTFDHLLDGVIVGCDCATRELTQVTVRRNRVTTKLLRPGNPECFGYPVMTHEEETPAKQGRKSDPRTDARAAPPRSATVIALDSRRPTGVKADPCG